jgi:multidrug efflux pump subunit AcrA (membrane-fusion protein)
MNDTNGLKPARTKEVARRLPLRLARRLQYRNKNNEPAKNWGNFHLTALGVMLLSALLVGCDNSVAQNAAPQAPAVSAADVVVKSISQWDSFNGRIEAVESVQLRPASPATLIK